MIGVRKGTFKSMREVTDTELKNIMTVRIEYPRLNVRIVVAHAPQETATLEDRTEFYEEVAIEAERCCDTGDKLIIVGDFNGRIQSQNGQIESSSPNGKLLQGLVLENDLRVGNFSPKTVGHWTRMQTKNGILEKSVLDYILMPDDTMSLLESMTIDEEKI